MVEIEEIGPFLVRVANFTFKVEPEQNGDWTVMVGDMAMVAATEGASRKEAAEGAILVIRERFQEALAQMGGDDE